MASVIHSNDLVVQRVDILSETAQILIGKLNTELTGRYPEEGATHFRLDPTEVSPGRGAFLVVFLNDAPVGCGAIRRIENNAGELKRMYVSPELRGRGIGRALVAALEKEARALGVSRLVLETGVRQAEAQALYARSGFSVIPAYGEYVGCPLSICMAKEL